MNDLIERINKKKESFSKTQLRIASYILVSGAAISFDSLDSTAEIIGVSRPSVIQFAKELGYSGYSEMQKQLRADMRKGSSEEGCEALPALSLGVNDLMKRTFEQSISNITKTMALLDPASAEAATQLIKNAKHVLVIGLRESFALAHYFYSRAVLLRENVNLANLVDSGMYESFCSYGENDTCVFFLFHEYTPIAFDILSILKARGVKIVLVTNPPTDKVLSFADACLVCSVDGFSSRNSTASVMVVIDYLTNNLLAGDYTATLNYLTSTSELVDKFYALRNFRKL